MLKSSRKSTVLFLISLILISSLAAGCSALRGSDSPIGSLFTHIEATPTAEISDPETENIETDISETESVTSETEGEAEIKPEETEEPVPETVTIRLWIPPQFDTEQNTQGGAALSEAIASYTEAHPNVNISLRVKATAGESSMLNTLTAANHIAKDVLPSMVLLSRSDMETAVQRGLAKQIATAVLSDSSSWYGYARQSAVIDSTIYGIPVIGDSLVLTYRKAKTGTELTDWQDILTRGLPIGFAPSSSSSLFGTFLYLSMGGKLTNDQGQAFIDKQKLTDTLNFFLSGGQNGAFPPSLAQLVDQAQVWQRFSEGTMSIIVSQFSSFKHYQTPEIDAHALPLSGQNTDYPLVNTWNLILIEEDPVLQQEAINFAEFLADINENDIFSAKAGYLPVRISDHNAWKDDPQAEIAAAISENAQLLPSSQILHKIVPIINNAVSQVIKNQATPDAAAQEAVNSLN